MMFNSKAVVILSFVVLLHACSNAAEQTDIRPGDRDKPFTTITPENGTLDYLESLPIVVQFNEPVKGVQKSNFAICPLANDLPACDKAIDFTFEYFTDTNIATLTPVKSAEHPSGLDRATKYAIRVNVLNNIVDAKNNALGSIETRFETVLPPFTLRDPPVKIKSNDSGIVLEFSEPMNLASLQAGVKVSSDGGAVEGNVVFGASSNIAIFQINAAKNGWKLNASYTLTLLTLVADANNIPLEQELNWVFSVESPYVARYAYSANFRDNSISAYRVNAEGGLEHHGYITTAHGVNAVAQRPNLPYVYAVSAMATPLRGEITVFTSAGDGFLSPLSNPIECNDFCSDIKASPVADYLVVSNQGNDASKGDITLYKANGDGTLAKLTSLPVLNDVTTVSGIDRLVVHPSGNFVYGNNPYGTELTGARIESSGLTRIEPSPKLGGVQKLAIDPLGHFLFATTDAAITVFRIDPVSGVLTQAGVPISASGEKRDIAVEPNGDFLLVVFKGSYPDNGFVRSYRIESDGALSAVGNSDRALGQIATSLAIAPNGQRVYAVSDYSNEIHEFTLDADSGLLTLWNRLRTRAGPQMLSVRYGDQPLQPVATRLYAASFSYDNNVIPISIGVNGVSEILGSPIDAPDHSKGLAITPNREFLFVGNNYLKSVSMYKINPDDSLSWQKNIDTGYAPWSMAVDPSNRYLFVVLNNSPDATPVYALRVYAIDAATPDLAPVGSDYAVGSNPDRLAVHPAGVAVYVVNRSGSTLSGFKLQSDGTLSTLNKSPYATGKNPMDIAVGLNGRFLYTANAGDFSNAANVSVFQVETDGALTGLGDVVSGVSPLSLALSPAADKLYVALGSGSGQIASYDVDRDTGLLSKFTPAVDNSGAFPFAMQLDAAAEILYVGSGDQLAAFRIVTNGALKALTGSPYSVGRSVDALTINTTSQ